MPGFRLLAEEAEVDIPLVVPVDKAGPADNHLRVDSRFASADSHLAEVGIRPVGVMTDRRSKEVVRIHHPRMGRIHLLDILRMIAEVEAGFRTAKAVVDIGPVEKFAVEAGFVEGEQQVEVWVVTVAVSVVVPRFGFGYYPLGLFDLAPLALLFAGG